MYRSDAQIATLSEGDLRRFVVGCAPIDEMRANPYDTRKPIKLMEAAKRLRIDAEAIRKTLKGEEAARGKGSGKPAGTGKLTTRKATA